MLLPGVIKLKSSAIHHNVRPEHLNNSKLLALLHLFFYVVTEHWNESVTDTSFRRIDITS